MDIIEDKRSSDFHCSVREIEFPLLSKCYRKDESLSGVVYSKSCPYCNIWTSLPDGASLATTLLFGCSFLGYDKRLKE